MDFGSEGLEFSSSLVVREMKSNFLIVNNLKGVMVDGRIVTCLVPKTFFLFGRLVTETSPFFDGGHAEVGHELKTSSGWSPVIASLHSDAQARVLQSKHQHISTTTS